MSVSVTGRGVDEGGCGVARAQETGIVCLREQARGGRVIGYKKRANALCSGLDSLEHVVDLLLVDLEVGVVWSEGE